MTKRIKPLPCPFCFGGPYLYKTKNGLIRHVMQSHMHDSKGKSVYPPLQAPSKIRKDTARGYEFIDIDGWEEVEDFLNDYINGFKNPSKRSSRFFDYVDK